MTSHKKNKHQTKLSKQVLALLAVALVITITIIFFWFGLTRNSHHNIEVTFIDPRQAIIFWQTDQETTGYVRYGNNRWLLSKVAEQTSSQPSYVHAALLDELPLEGIFLTVHNHSSWFPWPQKPSFYQYSADKE